MPKWALMAALLVALVAATPSSSAGLDVTVKSDSGKPIADAVVYALSLGADGAPVAGPTPTVIDQVDKEYVPYVTAVQAGTRISFPNRDQTRHHVYSFSEAKKFEIPLYKGTPSEPILFDKPGPVTLGCNIHDWMTAYVFVSESPYFTLTGEDGTATVQNLPDGDYAVRVWHPRIKHDTESTTQSVSVGNGNAPGSSLEFRIEQKRVWRPRRAPAADDEGGY
jgi:plastocyanin